MALKTLDEILAGEILTPEERLLLPQTENVGFTHLPIVFLLNTSASMSRDNAIGRVSNAVNGFFADVSAPNAGEFHRKLRRQGDFCIVTYGDNVKTILNWTAGSHLGQGSKIALIASGTAPMGAAIIQSADLLLNRYRGYKIKGTRAFCGLVLNLTNGDATDMDPYGDEFQRVTWKKAQERVALFETLGSRRNPYAQYIHFMIGSGSCAKLNLFAGENPLFMPTNSEESIGRVNLLETESFLKFIRFIEMSLNSIMAGGED
jgi:uncharacterized protein YegL